MSVDVILYSDGDQVAEVNWLRNGVGLAAFVKTNAPPIDINKIIDYVRDGGPQLNTALLGLTIAKATLLIKGNEGCMIELSMDWPLVRISPRRAGIEPHRVIYARGHKPTRMFPLAVEVRALFKLVPFVARMRQLEGGYWNHVDVDDYAADLDTLHWMLSVCREPGYELVVSC
jgi:hypothetical protein